MSRDGALTLSTFIITTIASLKLIGSYAVHVTALIRSVFVCVSCEVIPGHFTRILHVGTSPHPHPTFYTCP